MDGIDALAFDLYGTLLEVASVGRAAAEVTAEPAPLVDLWRQKQLEYTWLRSLMGRYQDFWATTADALDFALDRLGVVVDEATRARLLGAWLDVRPYPEVTAALDRLGSRRLGILSNGSPEMLEAGLAAGGELKQVKSAALLVVHEQPFPLVDLRVELDAQPLAQLRFLWELYQPQVEPYVRRALDPDSIPYPEV